MIPTNLSTFHHPPDAMTSRVSRITKGISQSSRSSAPGTRCFGITRFTSSNTQEHVLPWLFWQKGRSVFVFDRSYGAHRYVDYQSRLFSTREPVVPVDSLDGQIDQVTIVLESVSEVETKLMRENAAFLLNIPEGKMEHHMWDKAEDTFKWWISQRTEESVDVSVDLMERFVKEVQVDSSAASQLEQFFDKTVMSTLVSNWYHQWKKKKISWTPFRFLKALDYFRQSVPQVKSLEITGSVISYFINGLKVRGDTSKAAETADELLHYYLNSPDVVQRGYMSRYLINTVLNLWSKSGRSDAIERAEVTFSKVQQLDLWSLDIVAYNTMLDAYSQAGEAEKAQDFLLAMSKEWLRDWRMARPDQISVSTTATAWVRSRDPHAPERLIDLLRRLKDPLDPLGQLGITPDTSFFNAILGALAKSGRDYAPKRAYELLNVVDKLGYEGVKADSISYSIVADAFAKAGDPQNTEKVINELCTRYEKEKDEYLSPSNHLFTNLMDAWIRSNETHKEQKVRDVLDRVKKLHKGGILGSAPDTFLYNQVLTAIVSSDEPEKAKRADAFLQEMKVAHQNGEMEGRPNAWSYTTVIIAYLEKPTDVERAQELLLEAFSCKVGLSIKTPGRLIHVLAKTGYANNADAWLHRVFDMIEGGVFGEEEPSPRLLGGVMNGWLQAADRDKNSGLRASQLVKRMNDLKQKGFLRCSANLTAILALQRIWLRSGHEEGPDRAYEVIKYAAKKVKEGDTDIVPDYSMYVIAIDGYKEAGKAERAEMVFREMLSDYLSGNQHAKPELTALNHVLFSWANSTESGCSERAYSLIQKIHKLSESRRLNLMLSRKTYHFAMTACMKEKGTGTKMRNLFEQMRQSYLAGNKDVLPGGLTYQYVIETLVRDGMLDSAEAYLHDACWAFNTRHLRMPPSEELFNKVITALVEMKVSICKGQYQNQTKNINTNWIPNNARNPEFLHHLDQRIHGLQILAQQMNQSFNGVPVVPPLGNVEDYGRWRQGWPHGASGKYTFNHYCKK